MAIVARVTVTTEFRTERRSLSGWGRRAATPAEVLATSDLDVIAQAVRAAGPRGVIARGLGRS